MLLFDTRPRPGRLVHLEDAKIAPEVEELVLHTRQLRRQRRFETRGESDPELRVQLVHGPVGFDAKRVLRDALAAA